MNCCFAQHSVTMAVGNDNGILSRCIGTVEVETEISLSEEMKTDEEQFEPRYEKTGLGVSYQV